MLFFLFQKLPTSNTFYIGRQSCDEFRWIILPNLVEFYMGTLVLQIRETFSREAGLTWHCK